MINVSTNRLSPAACAKWASGGSPDRRRCGFSRAICSALPVLLALLSVSVPAAHAQSAKEKAHAAAAIATADHKAAIVNSGRIVFNAHCEICHFMDSNAQKIGPGLQGLFARARFADRTKTAEESVTAIIMDGGKDMPPFEGILKPGQLQALIAFLKSH